MKSESNNSWTARGFQNGWMLQRYLEQSERHFDCGRNMKLDQVYCAWLIKWVGKREINQLEQMCFTRWCMKKWYQFVLDGTGSGQCIAIVADTWWHWAFIPGHLVGCYRPLSDRQQNIVLLKLVQSLKSKLSHGILWSNVLIICEIEKNAYILWKSNYSIFPSLLWEVQRW